MAKLISYNIMSSKIINIVNKRNYNMQIMINIMYKSFGDILFKKNM